MAAEAPSGAEILIVEDDPSFQDLAASVLEDAGFRPRVFGGAEPALTSVHERKPDLALIDIGLPGGDGYGLCRALRTEAPELPIIFLTGWAGVESRLRGFEAGAQDYVTKPPCWGEVIARIRIHLKAKSEREVLIKRNFDLELADRVRRDAADMIVHDLKAPLSSILGTLELIRAQGLIQETQYQRLIDISRSASEMMLLLINDILDVERAKEAGLRAEPADVDLRGLTGKVEALFAPLCRQRGLRFRSEVARANARTDPKLLFRVLVNLVGNAVKFSPEGGEIRLGCERKREALRFTVDDDGPGVPDGLKSKIFERFVRGGREAMGREGSGIGLAFCRLASQTLRGRVWVEDRVSGGSRFLLELPA